MGVQEGRAVKVIVTQLQPKYQQEETG